MTEKFEIETPLNVTTEFQVFKVDNHSVILEFHSSVFERDDMEVYNYNVVAFCWELEGHRVMTVLKFRDF